MKSAFTSELPVINKCVNNSQLLLSNVYVSEKLWSVVNLVSVVVCSLRRSIRVEYLKTSKEGQSNASATLTEALVRGAHSSSAALDCRE